MSQTEIAIVEYNRATELNPRYAKAYNNRGIAYDILGKHERAITDFNRVIEIDPELPEAYGNRGLTYIRLGQFELALKDFRRFVELAPPGLQQHVIKIQHLIQQLEEEIQER